MRQRGDNLNHDTHADSVDPEIQARVNAWVDEAEDEELGLGQDEDEERQEKPTAEDEPEGETDPVAEAIQELAEELYGKDEEGAEDEAEAEEAEEGDEQGEAEPTYTVKVDGQEVEVTLDELMQSYSFTAHNTRKSQELAAARKEAETAHAKAAETREAYAQRLDMLQRVLGQRMSPADLKRIEEEYVALREAEAVESAAAREATVREQHEMLVRSIPEWEDERARKQELRDLFTYATETVGFTREDLEAVQDHRAMVLLRKAYLYDQLQARGQEAIQGKRKRQKRAKPLRPGSPDGRARRSKDAKRKQDALSRLKRTGSMNDASAAIMTLLDDLPDSEV